MRRKSLWRGAALFAGTSALLATATTGAYSAPGGVPGPGGPGGGGEEGTANSLSVPAIFVPGVAGAPTLNYTCGAAVDPGSVTTNTTSYFPALPVSDNLPGGVVAGDYYVQGEDTWQASCGTAAAGAITATADWGDNLSGDAKLSTGSPIRIEVGLTTTPATAMTGYDVVKLTDELDRDATYGTLGVAETPYDEVRVWAADAQFSISGPVPMALQPMSAEINSTGRVVYGYNWRTPQAGTYVISFQAPSVGVTTSIQIEVTGSTGGGGGGGGHAGGGHGGPGPRPR